jgi:threonine dehydratase
MYEPRAEGETATISIDDIRAAAETIHDLVERTPCRYSRTLSAITGAEVFCKLENLQFTASFKDRGAANKLLSLTAEERASGVIAVSAGNHAQAVAYHSARLGVHATIVMPRFTPNVKVENTRVFGGEIVLHGDTLSEAAARAQELACERKLTIVHPYDDEKIIAGQGTVALEMLEQVPDLAALVIPVGGGGLAAGCAIAAHALAPGIEIFGVQTDVFPAMKQALAGEPVRCGTSTVAEGIAVKQPGSLTVPIIREHVHEILLVSERAIEEAVLLLLEIEKTVAEGAGAAPLAALRAQGSRFKGRKVGLVLSGGNIDLAVLSAIIQRGLVRSQRMVRLLLEIPDVPGALAEAAALFGHAGANIVEIRHQRTFTGAPLRVAEVEVVLETRGHEHAAELLGVLHAAGYRARTYPMVDAAG